jgi:hypothetical protein
MSLLNRTFRNAQNNITNQIRDIGRAAGISSIRGGGNLSGIVFPSSLPESASDRTIFKLEINAEKTEQLKSIYLPCPPGLTFLDSANYSSVSLGVIGSLGVAAANTGGDIGEIEEMVDRISGAEALAAATSVANNIPVIGDIVGDGSGLSFARGAVINPRENTAFQSMNVRNFNFNFRLVAESESESDTIVEIYNTLTQAAYPKESGIVSLKYPPICKITFIHKGEESKYIPKIHKGYVTSINTSINQTSPKLWHKNGAPIDVELGFTFKEARSLTSDDMVELEKGNRDRVDSRKVLNGMKEGFSEGVKKIRDTIRKAREE